MEYMGLLALLARHGYALMFGLILLDNAGLPLPGEPVLLAFGFLAADGRLDLALGLTTAALGAVAGDIVSYWIGRANGDRILKRSCRFATNPERCIERAVAFYHRFGSATLIFGRFLIGLRALVVVLAGSTRVSFWKFLLFDVMGAVLWSGLFIGAGFLLGEHAAVFGSWMRSGSAVLATAVGAGLGLYLAASSVRSGRIRLYRRCGR